MKRKITCPEGHTWEEQVADPSAQVAARTCMECGQFYWVDELEIKVLDREIFVTSATVARIPIRKGKR